MKKRNVFLLFALMAFVALSACKGKKGSETGEDSLSQASGNAVCIWDKVSLKESPGADGKWLASISLGEKCNYLDDEKEVANGAKKTKFVKVELQDGKQGWVQADFIVIDGKPGAVIQNAEIYSRPDLLTKTGKSFSKMDIVGVKSEQNNFVEVVGKRKDGKWIESGWIKPSNVSQSDIDVAVAKYAAKAIAIEDKAKRQEAINEILTNSDLSGSVFMEDLRALITTSEGEEPEAEAADTTKSE